MHRVPRLLGTALEELHVSYLDREISRRIQMRRPPLTNAHYRLRLALFAVAAIAWTVVAVECAVLLS